MRRGTAHPEPESGGKSHGQGERADITIGSTVLLTANR